MRKQIQQHARVRLAPVVRRTVLGDAPLRVAGAIAPIVDRGAGGGQLLRHPAVEGSDRLLTIEPLGDAGLVGDDEQVIAHIVHELHRLLRSRNPLDLIRRVDVAVVDVEDAVAIEKDRRAAALLRHEFGRGGEAFRDADVDEKAAIAIAAQGAAADEPRQDVAFERGWRRRSFDRLAGEVIDAAVDQGGRKALAARTDRPNEVAVQFDRLVAVGLGDLAQRQGGACAVATRIRHQIEPVEIEPGVAVQQEKIVAEPRQRVDQSPAGAERRRLDREFDPAGEPPFDVAFDQKGDDRLAAVPGEQEEVVKSAPPGLAEQRFEKRRAADVQQGLGRRPGPLAKPGPKSAD